MAKKPIDPAKLAALSVERYGDDSLDYLTVSPRAKELRSPPPKENPKKGVAKPAK